MRNILTELKLDMLELHEREEMFRILTDAALEGIIIHQNGKILYVNKTMTNILDHNEDELIGTNILNYIAPEYKEYIIQKLEDTKNDETIDIITYPEMKIIKKNGIKITVSLRTRKFPFKEHGARIISCIDLTDEKNLEKENLEISLYADKMEAIGTLAGGIAHNFNNLLMCIQGHVYLMSLDIKKSDERYERILAIEKQIQSGSSLTKQLLGFARGGKYETKIINMNEIIKQSSELFSKTNKHITINYELEEALWNVDVDCNQMDQVLMNLYINAEQAMPSGGEIFIRTRNKIIREKNGIPTGNYIEIKIKDTGIGMDEKTKLRIFEPFFTTKIIEKGTGLGLASVYGIIKNHNGVIYVESEIGIGTIFIIYLPISDRDIINSPKKDKIILKGTETILVIDDEKHILELNKDLLKHIGYNVFLAGSGQEGLAIYMEKKNIIDLIIMDMIMPGLSGGNTFDKLREINPNIKVILSSGCSLNGDASDIMKKNCNGFIQKPFSLEDLSQKIREVLEK